MCIFSFHTLLTVLDTFTSIKSNDGGGNMCKIQFVTYTYTERGAQLLEP